MRIGLVSALLAGAVFLAGQVSFAGERFANLEIGGIQDSKTDLVWMKNGNCWGAMSWDLAGAAIAGLNGGKKTCEGYTGKDADWRLPTREELKTLLAEKKGSDGLVLVEGHPFLGVQLGHYWTAEDAETPETAWYVNMGNGHIDFYGKPEAYFVWPVRGGHGKK